MHVGERQLLGMCLWARRSFPWSQDWYWWWQFTIWCQKVYSQWCKLSMHILPLCIRSFIYDTFILTDNKPIRPVSTPRLCIDQLWAVYRILLDVKWRGKDPIWQPLPVDTWWQNALTQCTAKNWSKHRAQDLLVVMGIYRSRVISFEWSDCKTWVTIRANHDTGTTCLLPLYF